ncbi:MAG TPA: hypothetical protein VGH38_05380 [Bryobacteraceae bacterium]
MTPQESVTPIMDHDELLGFRETTERISGFLHKRLKEHLAALSPLLAPGRVFGKHAGGRESAPRADEALAELSEKYKQACGTLIFLKPELDEETLSGIVPTVQIHPYEYSLEVQGTKAARSVSMTSPVRWVLTYATEYSLSQMRHVLSGAGERRPQPVKQFVVNALALQVFLARSPGVSHLLRDLRYDIGVQSLPGMEGLPLSVFSVPVPSFRPPDDLLLTAIRLSGIPAFIELIDIDALNRVRDPLQAQIETLAEEAAA